MSETKREPWNHKDAIIAAALFALGAILGGSGLVWLRLLQAAVCHD